MSFRLRMRRRGMQGVQGMLFAFGRLLDREDHLLYQEKFPLELVSRTLSGMTAEILNTRPPSLPPKAPKQPNNLTSSTTLSHSNPPSRWLRTFLHRVAMRRSNTRFAGRSEATIFRKLTLKLSATSLPAVSDLYTTSLPWVPSWSMDSTNMVLASENTSMVARSTYRLA